MINDRIPANRLDQCVLIFGAGNIGCGFLGELVNRAGFIPVFVDINEKTIARINDEQGYRVVEVDNNQRTRITVTPAYALHAQTDRATIIQLMAVTPLIATAVGARALPVIAPLIAAGLDARASSQNDPSPVNIILAENLHHAAQYFRNELAQHIPDRTHGYLAERVGVVDSVIGRMVPVLPPDAYPPPEPLTFHVEPFRELPIDKDQLVSELPCIPNLIPVSPFHHYTARKLYIHNCGHAVLAYLGAHAGCRTIDEAIARPRLRGKLHQAWQESIAGLHHSLHCDPDWLHEHTRDLTRRFANKALADTIARIARDPIRKLQPEDRLIAPAKLAMDAGVVPHALAEAIAAAFHYHDPADPVSCQLQEQIANNGFRPACLSITGLNEDSKLFRMIEEKYRTFTSTMLS